MRTEDFKRVLFMGDIHGYTHVWKQARDLAGHFDVDAFVILGDFGWWNDDHPAAREFVNNTGKPCYWIDGNHENFDHLYENFDYTLLQPQETQENIFWLPRGTVMNLGRYQTMFFGGGTSVDRDMRIENWTWWSQEKITSGEINRAMSNWTHSVGPTMLVTHECPSIIYEATPELVNETKVKNPDSAHDRLLLDELLTYVKPDLHFHGHWHIYHNNWLAYPTFSPDPTVAGRRVRSVGLACEQPQNFWVENVSRG